MLIIPDPITLSSTRSGEGRGGEEGMPNEWFEILKPPFQRYLLCR